MLRSAVVVAMGLGLVSVGVYGPRTASAQEQAGQPSEQRPGRGQGEFAGMQRVGGEVTAVSGANVTVKTEAGETMQIVTTDNTRVMKARGTVKVADLKVGDGVIAMGNLDAPNKTLHAAMVMATDAAVVKALKDNLGKTYITGKVTAVDADDAKMTIERPDKVAQTIGFDETTSFKRGGRSAMGAMGAGMSGGFGGGGGGRQGGGGAGAGAGAAAPADTGESITLADIKVGDNVRATGGLKAGVFVPTEFVVVPGGGGGGVRRRGGGGEGAPAGGAAPAKAPAGPTAQE